MRASNKKRVMVLVALVLIAAIIPPVLFGTPRNISDQSGGDPWRNIIFDFQTLLTGLLAVGAALATVMTMERTDKEAERRHRELVALSLRADRLRVERMLLPALEDLHRLFSDIKDFDFPALVPLSATEPRAVDLIMRRLHQTLDKISYVLIQAPFVGAKDLFGGRLTYLLNELQLSEGGLRSAAGHCSRAHAKILEALNSGDTVKMQGLLSNVEAGLESLQDETDDYAEIVRQLLVSLEEMRDEYSIHLETPKTVLGRL